MRQFRMMAAAAVVIASFAVPAGAGAESSIPACYELGWSASGDRQCDLKTTPLPASLVLVASTNSATTVTFFQGPEHTADNGFSYAPCLYGTCINVAPLPRGSTNYVCKVFDRNTGASGYLTCFGV